MKIRNSISVVFLSIAFCIATVQAQSNSDKLLPDMQKEILKSIRKLHFDRKDPVKRSQLLKSVNLQRLDSVTNQQTDPISGELTVEKYEYIYNETLTEKVKTYVFDSTKMQWDSSRIEFLFYNQEKLITIDSICVWDTLNMQWKTNEKFVYSYANGNNTETLDYLWDNDLSQWNNNKKYLYSYNEADQILEETDMHWSDSLWVNDNFTQYDYSSDSLLNTATHFSWNDSLWLNTQRDTYSYNQDKFPEMLKMDVWNAQDSTWTDNVKINFSYDEHQNFSSFTAYYFYFIWLEVSKGNYTYDDNYTRDQLVLPPMQEDIVFSIRHMLLDTKMYYYNLQTQQWKDLVILNYYYSEHEYDKVNESISKDIRIYPNPFKDIFYVNNTHSGELLMIYIYNLDGKLLYCKTLNKGQVSITIPAIPSGMYIYQIISPSANFRGKIIKL